jgi:hypothetical protein
MTNWITIEDSIKGRERAVQRERERLLKILFDNDIIRRCGVTDKLVAMQTDGEHVIYISELEQGETDA